MNLEFRLTSLSALVVAAISVGTVRLDAQDFLILGRNLYASAAYEDALSALNRVSRSSPEVARQVDEYRAFCLFALGRTRDAEEVAEALVLRDPLTPLQSIDASPRVEQMFANVRKLVLPALIEERVRLADQPVDPERAWLTESALVETQLMIRDAVGLGVPADTFADSIALTERLLQQVRSIGAEATRVSLMARTPGTGRLTMVPVRAAPRRFYWDADKDVVPPIAIEQEMPELSRTTTMIWQAWKVSAALRVEIDETGSVLNAAVDRALPEEVESRVIGAVRQWKFVPALRNGVPVRYVKTIALMP
jgi:hypothetical protein